MPSISKDIQVSEPIPGLRLVTLHTPVADVVTLSGSFSAGQVFSPDRNPLLAGIVADTLSEGTRSKTKEEVRETLESVGASMWFGASQRLAGFGAKCLRKDTRLVLELLAEHLREPAFPQNEFTAFKKRSLGVLEESREDTEARAATAFLQALFPPEHPNGAFGVDKNIRMVRSSAPAALHAFHDHAYGLGDMILMAVGDVSHAALERNCIEFFGGWKRSPLGGQVPSVPSALVQKNQTDVVTLREKTNADFGIGQSIGIDREHPDFEPLKMAIRIFGGDFTSRLNAEIRDRRGLTYGIRARLGGVSGGYDGFWKIGGIFAPSLVAPGKAAAEELLRIWARDGITSQELEEKKKTVTGEFQVGLETTSELAGVILAVLERGKPLSYIDEYVSLVQGITLDQVNHAIATYVHPDAVAIAVAGSIDESFRPIT